MSNMARATTHVWAAILPFLVLALGACRTATPALPRYIVSTTPLNVVGTGHPGLCIAIDPTDTQGVWWWEPGPSGCDKRTTGPTVFRADRATVATTGSGDVAVGFNLQLMSGSRDIRIEVHDGSLRVTPSGAAIPTARRDDLDIPSAFGR